MRVIPTEPPPTLQYQNESIAVNQNYCDDLMILVTNFKMSTKRCSHSMVEEITLRFQVLLTTSCKVVWEKFLKCFIRFGMKFTLEIIERKQLFTYQQKIC